MFKATLLQVIVDDIRWRCPDAVVDVHRSDMFNSYRIHVSVPDYAIQAYDWIERQGQLDRDRERLVQVQE